MPNLLTKDAGGDIINNQQSGGDHGNDTRSRIYTADTVGNKGQSSGASEGEQGTIRESIPSGVERIHIAEGGRYQTAGGEHDSDRGERRERMGSSDTDGTPGGKLNPISIPKPRDIILSFSEITALANSGAVARFNANVEAIKTLKVIESQNRSATPEEQVILSKYSGFGDSAFNSAFDRYQRDESWKRRARAWLKNPSQYDINKIDTKKVAVVK